MIIEKSLFTPLKDDDKTYNYFLFYINNLSVENNNVLAIDNEIQIKEFSVYLLENNIDYNRYPVEEVIWIDKTSKVSRCFLNSLKVLYMMYCTNKDRDNFCYDDFKSLVKIFNENLVLLINNIF